MTKQKQSEDLPIIGPDKKQDSYPTGQTEKNTPSSDPLSNSEGRRDKSSDSNREGQSQSKPA